MQDVATVRGFCLGEENGSAVWTSEYRVTESEKVRQLENRLWEAADQLRANSSLAASQYSIPVLGLIFLRYADVLFAKVENELAGKATRRKEVGKADYQAKGVMYLPEIARFSYLKALPEGTDIGRALNQAMEATGPNGSSAARLHPIRQQSPRRPALPDRLDPRRYRRRRLREDLRILPR
jgi:hypothetical protein